MFLPFLFPCPTLAAVRCRAGAAQHSSKLDGTHAAASSRPPRSPCLQPDGDSAAGGRHLGEAPAPPNVQLNAGSCELQRNTAGGGGRQLAHGAADQAGHGPNLQRWGAGGAQAVTGAAAGCTPANQARRSMHAWSAGGGAGQLLAGPARTRLELDHKAQAAARQAGHGGGAHLQSPREHQLLCAPRQAQAHAGCLGRAHHPAVLAADSRRQLARAHKLRRRGMVARQQVLAKVARGLQTGRVWPGWLQPAPSL